MKFNFFKKIWGRKEKPQKERPDKDRIYHTDENRISGRHQGIQSGEHQGKINFYRGADFKILPLITEKTLRLAKENKYTFLVEPKVNKEQIKNAVEKVFNVKVIKVRTINYKKRQRGLTKIKSTRPRFKKAIVQLQSGQTIPIFE